jgi:hypothetical protein
MSLKGLGGSLEGMGSGKLKARESGNIDRSRCEDSTPAPSCRKSQMNSIDRNITIKDVILLLLFKLDDGCFWDIKNLNRCSLDLAANNTKIPCSIQS